MSLSIVLLFLKYSNNKGACVLFLEMPYDDLHSYMQSFSDSF